MTPVDESKATVANSWPSSSISWSLLFLNELKISFAVYTADTADVTDPTIPPASGIHAVAAFATSKNIESILSKFSTSNKKSPIF